MIDIGFNQPVGPSSRPKLRLPTISTSLARLAETGEKVKATDAPTAPRSLVLNEPRLLTLARIDTTKPLDVLPYEPASRSKVR